MIYIKTDFGVIQYKGNITLELQGAFLLVNWDSSTPSQNGDWVTWNSNGFDIYEFEDVKSIMGFTGPLLPINPAKCFVINNIK